MPYTICEICAGACIEDSTDIAQVHSNVRRFRHEKFTVWRCPRCGALHTLEDIDYDKYYNNYFLQNQKPDFFTTRLFHSRLNQLRQGGLKKHHAILDYGCGNGAFVYFLRSQGYLSTHGYDPYSKLFCDHSICDTRFDFVTSQDVIEHTPDPSAFADTLSDLVKRPGGMLAIGTPDARNLLLTDPVDITGQLHQPFHRHILTSRELIRKIETLGFEIKTVLHHSYLDTWIPFINSRFLFNYMTAIDGTVDSGYDPIDYKKILTSPRLLLLGLFGRAFLTRKDILVIAKAMQ